MTDYKKFVPNVHYELIPLKNLVSNQEYQRDLSEAYIRRAVENFDLYQINPVKVSRRDGLNYVINGQHTIEIVARKSEARETPVWCMIYDDLEYTHEADIFANQQKYVKPLTPYDIFAANIEAGNEEQLTLKAIVESYNMRISKTKCYGGICAISALEYIYRTFGYAVLDQTLKLCIATWEGEVNSFGANMLKGIAKLVVAYGDELDENIFKEKLGAYSINKIVRSATERNNGSTGYAEAMLDCYNKRLKNPLHKSKLKSNKFINIPEYSVKSLYL